MKDRASDRLNDRLQAIPPDFMPWCGVAISLWQTDPDLHREFSDAVDLLDWMVAEAELIIRSADRPAGSNLEGE